MAIGGQVLSGVGLTFSYMAIPLTSGLVPKKERPKVQTTIGIAASIANCVGFIIAGAFIKNKVGGTQGGWRGAFNLGAGFFALSFLAILVFYHHAHLTPEDTLKSSTWGLEIRGGKAKKDVLYETPISDVRKVEVIPEIRLGAFQSMIASWCVWNRLGIPLVGRL